MHKNLSLNELRQTWSLVWNQEPPARIGRKMLEKSLTFKTQNNLTQEQQIRLDQLIKQYKRNPNFLDKNDLLKPGTRLIRNWKNKQHSVLVKIDGFEYQEKHFKSLSQIANQITGTRWNGHIFFGLKKGVKQ